jgi:hypothetical protein
MDWYVGLVSSAPLAAAFIQFFFLGTLGELLGILAAKKKPSNKALEWLLKALVWGALGIVIKYAFAGFAGFLEGLAHKGFLPASWLELTALRAFLQSLVTNAMFGPYLMLIHRTTDNWITGSKGYAGIEKSLVTLAWFWLPAHTVTFALPVDYQIGLAALWSVALGIIMGFTKRSAKA